MHQQARVRETRPRNDTREQVLFDQLFNGRSGYRAQYSITFGSGASTGTLATAGGGAETFAAGDRLAIINQNPADATLADLSITFLGRRT